MAWIRRLGGAKSPADVAELLSSESGSRQLSEEEGQAVLSACLERGREDLAMSIYKDMCMARVNPASLGWDASPIQWPTATIRTTTAFVLALCKHLYVQEAMSIVNNIKGLGLQHRSADVGFGKVITCPLAPSYPLAVVQPQEGCKVVADAYTKYEYELFTGSTVGMSSEALPQGGSLVFSVLRAVGVLKQPPVGAVHEFVLRAPDGTSRTFRVGTETGSVPAQVGERVTMVCSPVKNVKKGGIFNASPPGTRPGEGLSATNHSTGQVLPLIRPPAINSQSSLPQWLLPMAVILAGGDAASSLLDPSLPLLIAAGAATLATSVVAGNNVLLPRLKQLPDVRVRIEYTRQRLLGQYSSLTGKVGVVLQECAEDVRFLARLWQLQVKMEAAMGQMGEQAGVSGAVSSLGSSHTDGGAGSSPASAAVTPVAPAASAVSTFVTPMAGVSYKNRISRVAVARSNIEERLARRLELLEGYSRVMNMIEIEVEMDLEVPAAEVAGIEDQINKLVELEGLQEDWRSQAEARDEVERLLRATS